MTVRAKMYLNEIAHQTWGTKLSFQVVTRGEDNKEWASSTPSGTLQLSVKNERAAEQFTLDQLGTEFFIDITPVPDELQREEGMAG